MALRIAVFGGIYNNYLALERAIADAKNRGVDELYCLGDFGAFGPHPDRVFPLLIDHEIVCIQGNYDNSLANGLSDCQCGYTDPRDNYFAAISYKYTFDNTCQEFRDWMGTLPQTRRLDVGEYRLLFCHGSPRKMNEFLWESTTPDQFVDFLCDQFQANVLVNTHTGMKWHLETNKRNHLINVGVLGRPENDGKTNVWYAILTFEKSLTVEFMPVFYDFDRLAREMAEENLPSEFCETIVTGWWTTCLEILPSKERRRGRF